LSFLRPDVLNLAVNGRRLGDGLDLPGNVVGGPVQCIAESRPGFGGGCGGVCVHHGGLRHRLRKGGADTKKNGEHDPE
jgi:hypothetical protein